MALKIRRPGFTLIELLVTVSIIGVVVGLLLPAIQSSREAARRAECSNRMKQIGLALHAQQSLTGVFPVPEPGRYLDRGLVFGSCSELSGYYELLPHLELTTLYNAINFGGLGTSRPIGISIRGPENFTVYGAHVDQFLCASDGIRSLANTGAVSYRFNVGSSHPFVPPAGLKVGAFDIILPAGPQAFTDGLAHTVGFGERLIGSQSVESFDRRRDFWAAGVWRYLSVTTDDQTRELCAISSGKPADFGTRLGRSWMTAGNFHVQYNHVDTPNSRGTDCSDAGFDHYQSEGIVSFSMTLRSNHPGGVNALMMDGSVRFVKDAISLPTWRSLGSRSGGEIIPVEF